MTDEIKKIDIKEFREKGYLQELNRRFLHPLGLAMEVIINKESGEESLGGVWDYREDTEGIYYAFNEKKFTNAERLKTTQQKFDSIESELAKRSEGRIKSLGFLYEPIPDRHDTV